MILYRNAIRVLALTLTSSICACSAVVKGGAEAMVEEPPLDAPDAGVAEDEPCLAENRVLFYLDQDSDGFGHTDVSVEACEAPAGFVDNFDDCDDSSFAVNPLALEVCGDGIDNDCSGGDPCQEVLVAHWDFEGIDADALRDAAGGLEASLRGGAQLTGTGLAFDGTDDYAEIPHAATFELNSGTLSLVALSQNPGTLQGLWSKDSEGFDAGGHLLVEMLADDSISVRLQSPLVSNLVVSLPVTRGEFHHIAFSFGAGGMQLYVDGLLVANNAFTGGIEANLEPIALGTSTKQSGDGVSEPITDPMAGLLGDTRLYSRELSATEIAELAALQLP